MCCSNQRESSSQISHCCNEWLVGRGVRPPSTVSSFFRRRTRSRWRSRWRPCPRDWPQPLPPEARPRRSRRPCESCSWIHRKISVEKKSNCFTNIIKTLKIIKVVVGNQSSEIFTSPRNAEGFISQEYWYNLIKMLIVRIEGTSIQKKTYNKK